MILSSLIHQIDVQQLLNIKDLLKELNDRDRATYNSFIHDHDKCSFIAARLLLKKLGHIINPDFKLSEIQYTKLGKPWCRSLSHISIAHSTSYSIAAISDNGRIGVDIQYHTPINIDDYASVLNDKELKQLYQLSYDDRLKHFYHIWTLKEAIMKADGRGFHLDPKLISGQDKTFFIHDTGKYYFSYRTPLLTNYSIALVSDRNNEQPTWNRFHNTLKIIE